MKDPLLHLAMDTLEKNKQAIIFASSRASAEKAAEDISKLTSFCLPELEKEILKAASTPTRQCRKLSHCINKGIAFHHAGLLQKQKDLIETEFKNGKIKIICATPTLCLAGDTKIWQPKGDTLVKDFSDSDLFALSQNKLVVMKAKNVHKNMNLQKLIKITSVSGHSIKLTPNHKVLVKRNNRKELIEAIECKVKDKIATVGKLNIQSSIKPKISNFVIDNELPIKDKEFTEDDFYFIGSMLGDGHSGAETRNNQIYYKGSPTFTSNDQESIELIEGIAKKFDPFTKKVKKQGSISLVLSKRKWFREFLCRCGVELGKDKYIHQNLMQTNLNLIKFLIRGLFDTDGYVQKGRNLGFSNISLKLIQDLQRSLLRFGIVTRVRKRPGRRIFILRKFYQVKDQYELTITQQKGILLFRKHIGFNLKRKQEALDKLIVQTSQLIYSECKNCNYKIYSELFSGRTKEQKEWGNKKKQVIKLLGEKFELGSRKIEKFLNFIPRHKTGNRLNHHYELISKRKIGSRSKTEWFWSLKPIGSWIYWKIIKDNKDFSEFFKLTDCPVCKSKLNKELRKKWRDSDFEGDIFWDYIREVKEVETEGDVYDVVLPDKPNNDHMFVANGFIVHNSAGLSLPAFRVIIRSLKRFSNWGMDWIPVLEYLQMAGRAGRPEYEKYGESIIIAKDDKEKDKIYERYICGVPEDIYSKVAVEPVLRTYLLSLISSGIIKDEKSMLDFFSKTFWAHQYGDMKKLQQIMEKMLVLLEEWEFVKIYGNENYREDSINHEAFSVNTSKEVGGTSLTGVTDTSNKSISTPSPMLSSNNDFIVASNLNKNNTKNETEKKLRPTLIGRRISELYLDPLTAKHLLDCLNNFNDNTDNNYELNENKNNNSEQNKNKNNNDGKNENKNNNNEQNNKTTFSLLQMICNTLEMRPLLRIKSKEDDKIQEELVKHYDELLKEEPSAYDPEYDDFMNSIKTALFFEAWIDECDEDFLLEKFDIRPGEIRVKQESADWLLYAAAELAMIKNNRFAVKEINKLRIRVKNGVRKDILPLLKLKGVGRIRARRLYNKGVKDLGGLRKIDLTTLSELVGKALALSIKEQLGQEIKEIPKGTRKGQLSIEKF